jgi:dipeptidyl aminopeptidase/acylaminoacyl peptidase
MSIFRQRIGPLLIATALISTTVRAEGQQTSTTKRAVTVQDMISMLTVAGPYPDSSYSPSTAFAVFSPRADYFAFAVSRGNLDNNTTESSLWLFRTADLPHAKPRTLVTLCSSSNRAAISDIRWGRDGREIYFLGSEQARATQLYRFSLRSEKVEQLTHHASSLESYGLSDNDAFVFAAEPPLTPVLTEVVRKQGMDITSESVVDLVRGELSSPESELFISRKNSSREWRLNTGGGFDSGINDLYLSPNGQYLVVKTSVREVPERWADYDDLDIKTVLRVKAGPVSDTRILHYELIDTRTGKAEALLDAPTTYRCGDVLWAPDSQSVILSGTYLPLDLAGSSASEIRKSMPFVVEVRLKTRKIIEITKGNLLPLNWTVNDNVVRFSDEKGLGDQGSVISYIRTTSGWRLLDSAVSGERATPRIEIKQGLNSPPEVAVVNPVTKELVSFWKLNPQFAQLRFGPVEAIQWQDASGHSVRGALYLPPDYDSRQRYPLVIQTHGFDPASFSISGYYNTAFAAQPLAARHIVVLQVDDIFYDSLETSQEPERALAAYESAIHQLDRRGVIDPGRVGIIGFSRTSLYVKYALTHSALHFAAAIICDGFDAGYFQYLLFANSIPFRDSEMDAVIGARPFGDGISEWRKRSPGFLLDRVTTPVLIQAIGPTSLLGEWEWFSGLKRLNRPVDLLYLPTGVHVLVKPWDRMASQSGTVDWFCFWLKEEQDPVAARATQYERWNRLRHQLVALHPPDP